MTLARPMFPPVDPTRRHFLSQAAGVAAGGTVLALATIPPAPAAAAPARLLDPVFSLIEAHRAASHAFTVALIEQNRLELIGDPLADSIAEDSAHANMDTFILLVETAPTTFAGMVAWAAYLDEVRQAEVWMIEDHGAKVVETLVEATRNLALSS